MSDEQFIEPIGETPPEFIDPSPYGADVIRHYDAIEPCGRIPVNKAFTLPRVGYSAAILRDILAQLSSRSRVLVMIEHAEYDCYEIRRLPDGVDGAYFLKAAAMLAKSPLPEDGVSDDPVNVGIETLCAAVTEALTAAFVMSDEETHTFDKAFNFAMKNEQTATHTYLHRRLAGKAMFRKYPGGGTAALKEAIDKLIAEGVLVELPAPFVQERFETRAKCYRLIAKESE